MNTEALAADTKYPQARLLVTSGAVALLIVGLIFFDVIFLHRSLQPSNIYPQIGRPADWRAASVLPALNPKIDAGFGYGDLGASAWQSEPARYVMARDFQEGQSPFWNPYSAAGTLGPETLVDIKFSPLTLISAYFFNSSPESFDFGLIILYCIAVFFIVLVLHGHFRLSLISAIAGAVVFLLNGFSLPNLNSHIGQPYYFSPVLLYALLAFSNRQTLVRWIFLVVTHAVMLTITFLPTLLLSLLTVHVLNLACFLQGKKPTDSLFRYVLLLLSAFFAAFLLVAPLWFPIIDSFFVGDMLTSYASRANQIPREFSNLLSIFTPKHFWENYSEILHADVYPDAGFSTSDDVIAHTGIIAALIASYAVTRSTLQNNKVILVSLVLLLLSYLRVFGCLGFVDHIPILRSIGLQYMGCASAIALTLLVAYGIENIQTAKTKPFSAILVLVFLIVAFSILFSKLGFVSALPYRHYLEIIIGLFTLAVIIVAVELFHSRNRKVLTVFVLALMTTELLFYMNTLRPIRYSAIAEEPAFVTFLKDHIHEGRVLNIGVEETLYPEYGALYGIKQIDTQNPGQLPWYRAFYKRNFGNDLGIFLGLTDTHAHKTPKGLLKDNVLIETALDAASVKFILVVDTATRYLKFFQDKNYPLVFHQNGLTIFENVDALPSAQLVPALLVAEGFLDRSLVDLKTYAITRDPELRTEATRLGVPVVSDTNTPIPVVQGSAALLSYRNTEIVCETQSAQPALLVFSEVWHPNWKATIDGQPAYLGRVNMAFRGMILPAGTHTIRMVYDSAALRYGIYVSTLIAFLILAVILYKCLRTMCSILSNALLVRLGRKNGGG